MKIKASTLIREIEDFIKNHKSRPLHLIDIDYLIQIFKSHGLIKRKLNFRVKDRLDEFVDIVQESDYKTLLIMRDEVAKEIRVSETAQAEGYEKA